MGHSFNLALSRLTLDQDKKTAKERLAREKAELNAGGSPLIVGGVPIVANSGTMNIHNSVFSTSTHVGGVNEKGKCQ